MEKEHRSKISDQFQFVLHKIVFGAATWLVLSWSITCQKAYADSQGFKYVVYGLGSAMVYFWFFHTTNRKSTWKVFNENTNMIGIIITAVTAIFLAYAIGVPQIILQY